MRNRRKWLFWLPALLALTVLAACAPRPVRRVVPLDRSLPAGKVDGTRFTGIRVPMVLDAGGTGWTLSTQYPDFLPEQGYGKEGLSSAVVFAFNPKTRSSLHVSFVPAGPHATFDQEGMEWLAGAVAEGAKAEFAEGHTGHGSEVSIGRTGPVRLAGVPFAARNFAAYEAAGQKRENGWVYAFAEPYQIFILYQLVDPDRNDDREAVERLLASFRYLGVRGGS